MTLLDHVAIGNIERDGALWIWSCRCGYLAKSKYPMVCDRKMYAHIVKMRPPPAPPAPPAHSLEEPPF